MKLDFKFSNLCGTVYKTGNLLFTPDGNSLVSPVGNRVSVFDLINNKSITMPFENRKDIVRMCLSPNGNILITVDSDGRALLVNFNKQIVLHHHWFKATVYDIAFSPDGRFIAVTHEKHVQIWNAPGYTVEFAPFVLHKEFPGHYDDVTCISWSTDSRFFITGSKDMACRIYAVHNDDPFPGAVLTGHHDVIIGAWFTTDSQTIYTVGRDGALFQWELQNADLNVQEEPKKRRKADDDAKPSSVQRWKSCKRHYFNQNHAKIVSAAFHSKSNLLSVGFDSGVFGIWELPDFVNIHTLSISQKRINAVAVNCTGEWLAFGCSKLGQLLVWEWQSESYVLKQQGHHHNMNCLSYSPDGQFVATGGDDGKIKLWNTQTGFCFVTFSEHSSSITALEFAKRGQVVFSASLDGTIRAFDLVRYRNFRTFTSLSPVQFSSLAVDASGEVLCAGTSDTFEIYMWSVQTGRLLEILPGHEGPVSSLMFSSTDGILASASWDKTVRVWDVYSRDKHCEVMDHEAEVICLSFTPDCKQIASTTLKGHICLWDLENSKLVMTIEGRKDIAGGRSIHDKMTAANAASGKHFTSICFSADGSGIIAGGDSKFVCIYDTKTANLLKKFQISHNQSLDAMNEFLNSKAMTEGGPIDLIDQTADLSDLEDRLDKSLPGVQSGDHSKRLTRPQARTSGVKFSPTGCSWAAASTEGLIIYSLDQKIVFDPFDLDIDITPDSVSESIENQEWTKSLVMSFRLGEQHVIKQVYEQVPSQSVPLLVRDLPTKYLERLIKFLVGLIETNPRLEFHLVWVTALLKCHGPYLRDYFTEFSSAMRGLSKVVTKSFDELAKLSNDNIYLLDYLIDRSVSNQNIQEDATTIEELETVV